MLDLLGDDGKQGANGSASAGGADDVKLTVQLVDALAHTGDTHAQRDLRGSVGNHVVDSNAVIFNFDQHGIRVAFDAHAGGSGAGMAVHVGKRFLHDAKNRELEALLEAAKVIGDFSLHRDPSAFGE